MAAYTYKAFISYKHSVSGKTALALEKALRRYAKPMFRPPMRVFRDEEQIAAGQSLKETIKTALDKSEFLIYIATREAAESPYVIEELDIWCRQLDRKDRLIIIWQKDLLADNPKENALLWEQTNCIPQNIKDHIIGIPIWADLTWATSDEDLDLRNPRFKTLINSIIARFRNIPPEELTGEEIKIYRRNIHIRNWGITALVLLLLAATGAAGIARHQLNKARSTILINQANNIIDQDNTLALNFAKEGYSLQVDNLTGLITDTLLKTYYHEGFKSGKKYIRKLQHEEGLTTATFSRTGDMIITGSTRGKISVWSLDGTLLSSFPAHRFKILSADISPDSTQIVTTGYMDVKNFSIVKLWSLDGKLIDTLEGPPSEYTFAEFSPDDNSILAGFGTPYYRESVKYWVPKQGAIELINNKRHGANNVRFSKDGQFIWMAANNGNLVLLNRNGEKVDSFALKGNRVIFSKTSDTVVSAYKDEVICFNLVERRESGNFKTDNFRISSTISSQDSKHILTVMEDGSIAIMTCEGEIRSRFKPEGKKIEFIDFIGNGNMVFASTDSNMGYLWDLDGHLLNTFSGHSKSITSAMTSPDNKLLLTASMDGTVKLWPMQIDISLTCACEIPNVVSFNVSSEDDSMLLLIDKDKHAKLLNLKHPMSIKDLGQKESVQNAFFAVGEKEIHTINETDNINLEDPNNSDASMDLKAGTYNIKRLPDAKGFLGAGTSGKVVVWNNKGKVRYTWSSLGESGSFSPVISPDGNMVMNPKTKELFNLKGERINTIGRDRFLKYLPDGKYMITILENYKDKTSHTLYLRDRYGNIVVSLGEITGDAIEAKILNNGKVIVILTSNQDLVLRCTPDRIYSDLSKTKQYEPDYLDRIKYGIDW